MRNVGIGFGSSEEGVHYWIVANSEADNPGKLWGIDGSGRVVNACEIEQDPLSVVP